MAPFVDTRVQYVLRLGEPDVERAWSSMAVPLVLLTARRLFGSVLPVSSFPRYLYIPDEQPTTCPAVIFSGYVLYALLLVVRAPNALSTVVLTIVSVAL